VARGAELHGAARAESAAPGPAPPRGAVGVRRRGGVLLLLSRLRGRRRQVHRVLGTQHASRDHRFQPAHLPGGAAVPGAPRHPVRLHFVLPARHRELVRRRKAARGAVGAQPRWARQDPTAVERVRRRDPRAQEPRALRLGRAVCGRRAGALAHRRAGGAAVRARRGHRRRPRHRHAPVWPSPFLPSPVPPALPWHHHAPMPAPLRRAAPHGRMRGRAWARGHA